MLIACGLALACASAIGGCKSDPSTPGESLPGVLDATDGPPGGDAAVDGDGGPVNVVDGGDSGATSIPTPPSVQYFGRFDNGDPFGPRMAWPGGRVVSRFDGTAVSARVTQAPGSLPGQGYANVVVDGAERTPIAINDGTQTLSLATGLSPGTHTVELEKRTDGRVGVLRFEEFVFTGGKGMLAPAKRGNRRVEILGDDFISGLGIEGDATRCAGASPAQYDNVRKSFGALAANSLGAEVNIVAHPGKGLVRNSDASLTDTFPSVYQRSLPESVSSVWSFPTFVPDVVVIVLGAADWDGTQFPATLQTTYNQLITDIHARYAATTKTLLVVWSQHHSTNGMRAALTTVIDAVIAGRPNADKPHNSKLVLPEASAADETGCQGRGNAAHHAAMAALLAAEIRAKLGWN